MIKVDHVYTGSLTSTVGPSGTIRRLLKNATKLREEGIDLSVINHGQVYKSWDDESFSSFKPKSMSLKHKFKTRLDVLAKDNKCLSIALMQYYCYNVKRAVKHYLSLNRTPDVVVFHGEHEAYYYLLAGTNTKTACFFHSDSLPMEMNFYYYPKLRGTKFAQKQIDKFQYAVENISRCVFICQKGKDNMNTMFPISSEKSALVINGIDDLNDEQKRISGEIRNKNIDNRIRLVSVGSISLRKGQRLILEALGKLPKEIRRKYFLTIIGEGSDMDFCKKYANENDLNDIVEFTGAIPNVEVYKHLAKNDVFVLMSNNEGLPISIIEAMRSHLAILATNVSGIPELVTNNNGVLVNVSVDELYDVLYHYEKYDWKTMGMASRELFENKFTFERMLSDYVIMVKSLYE